LLDRLQQRLNGRTEVILLGARDDNKQRSAALEFTRGLPPKADVVIRDLVNGRYDYAAQAAELQTSDYLIGGDSSWGHMAAALGVKTLYVLGDES
jgi:ADP-heptose:LPS heptosyltransferase